MKKKTITLTELSVKSFNTGQSREVLGGMELIADGSLYHCDTGCVGRYCDPA